MLMECTRVRCHEVLIDLVIKKKREERKIGVMVDGYIVVVRRNKYVIMKSENAISLLQ
jgi:hypothetical protein